MPDQAIADKSLPPNLIPTHGQQIKPAGWHLVPALRKFI
jgi:hypothetical protein